MITTLYLELIYICSPHNGSTEKNCRHINLFPLYISMPEVIAHKTYKKNGGLESEDTKNLHC